MIMIITLMIIILKIVTKWGRLRFDGDSDKDKKAENYWTDTRTKGVLREADIQITDNKVQ